MKESEMQFNLALSCGYQEFESYNQMWEFQDKKLKKPTSENYQRW